MLGRLSRLRSLANANFSCLFLEASHVPKGMLLISKIFRNNPGVIGNEYGQKMTKIDSPGSGGKHCCPSVFPGRSKTVPLERVLFARRAARRSHHGPECTFLLAFLITETEVPQCWIIRWAASPVDSMSPDKGASIIQVLPEYASEVWQAL